MSHPPESGPGDDREYRDALPSGPVRGRGAGLNPGNRFEAVRLHVLGERLDEIALENPGGTQIVTRVYRDHSRTLINRVDSPDVGFEWTINPYRGCEHGCIYCYARPGHEYLGLSSGLDFETRIFAKTDAPRLLRNELGSPKWEGATISLSGVTDPYQPIEEQLRITRGCLEVMAECNQPVGIVTKNRLIVRDLDLLSKLASINAARVIVSLTSLNPKLARVMEPRASSPADRLKTIRDLAEAGVPVMVMTAPIVPGLNDEEIPALLQAAADHGAVGAAWVMLRLPYQIKDLFLDWLRRNFPERAGKIESRIREIRGGALNESQFRRRMRGSGQHAELIGQTFRLFAARYGLDRRLEPMSSAAFRRPEIVRDPEQLRLF